MDEISDIVSSDSLMFSKDSEKLDIFFTEEVAVPATVAFNLGVFITFFIVEGVEGPKVLFNFINLAGVGGILEANLRFLAEEYCSKCWGMGGFCIFFARLAYRRVFKVSVKSFSVGLMQAIIVVYPSPCRHSEIESDLNLRAKIVLSNKYYLEELW